MRKVSELFDMEVLEQSRGERVGTIVDVCWNSITNKPTAVLLTTCGMAPNVRAVYPEDIVGITKTDLIVAGKDKLRNVKEVESQQGVQRFKADMVGRPVIRQNGAMAGVLKDIKYDFARKEYSGMEYE